jgi:hypothetical protein
LSLSELENKMKEFNIDIFIQNHEHITEYIKSILERIKKQINTVIKQQESKKGNDNITNLIASSAISN